MVLEPGERVGVAEVGLLATVGAVKLQVYQQPSVAVLSTGESRRLLGCQGTLRAGWGGRRSGCLEGARVSLLALVVAVQLQLYRQPSVAVLSTGGSSQRTWGGGGSGSEWEMGWGWGWW